MIWEAVNPLFASILRRPTGLNVYSIGQIQRSLAQKYNMDVLAFNKYMESHPEIDER